MTNVTPHNTVVGSNEVVDQHLFSCYKLLPNYGHIWHPDSFGTQFLNGTLTIAINGLSLDNDWCDPNRFLQDRGRASSTKFSVMDCYPPGTNMLEVDEASLSQAFILVDQSNGHKQNDLVSPPYKKAKLIINPKSGSLLHLTNMKSKGTRHKGDMAYEDQLITKEPITPSMRVSKTEGCETHERNKGKKGVPYCPINQIFAFRSTLNDCGIFDLGFDGNQHT
ncbi:hypothetical protein D8674_035123 [Pyrus ussuriensis x Pyrus communis]|uniref:Uncharacterized protein n=1 Tax=Pyrus ussuriensis x Pyrus communis TaxID=2448454 RepID=A0A5N5GCA8_9ROSA|nr:hypothetical protein D8674_035123 [Pyrus ussuriensis x Pyrus communis]